MKALLAAIVAAVLTALTPSFAAQPESIVVAQAKVELNDINRAKAIIMGSPDARKDKLFRNESMHTNGRLSFDAAPTAFD